jgi:hypothetical protein
MARYLKSYRTIAWQRLGEGDKRLIEGFVDEQAAKPGAIDEQIAFDEAMVFGANGMDESVLRQLYLLHVIDYLAYPAFPSIFGHEFGNEAGIKVIGVGILNLQFFQKQCFVGIV